MPGWKFFASVILVIMFFASRHGAIGQTTPKATSVATTTAAKAAETTTPATTVGTSSAPAAISSGTLTILMDPSSGWINYTTTDATVTFNFTPACSSMALYKHGEYSRQEHLCVAGRGCSLLASTSNLWGSSQIDPSGAWIRVSNVKPEAVGQYYGLCTSNNVTYTTESLRSGYNLAIGVNPRIVAVQVRHGSVFSSSSYITKVNLTRTTAANGGDDSFGHSYTIRPSSSFSYFWLFIAVQTGQLRWSPNSTDASSLPLRVHIPEFETPRGNYYSIAFKDPIASSTSRGVHWIAYKVYVTALANHSLCSVQGRAIAHLPGAQFADSVRFFFGVRYSSKAWISVVRKSNSTHGSCSCTFSCNLFSCPASSSSTSYKYKWAIFNKRYSSSSPSSSSFVEGNDLTNPEQYTLSSNECHRHYKQAMLKPTTYSLQCNVYNSRSTSIFRAQYSPTKSLYSLLRPCDQDEWQCPSDKSCISIAKKCNGHNDCADGADESNCTTTANACPLGEFQCPTTSECVVTTRRCDGVSDCPDKSDEANCTTLGQTPCPTGYFICGTSRCVRGRYVCDGDNDCGDRTDEMNCGSRSSTYSYYDYSSSGSICTTSQLQCSDSSQCVSSYSICDGISDCDNNLDEERCGSYFSATCGTGFWKCSNGRCVSGSDLCDGSNDCGDYSDEQVCGQNSILIRPQSSTTVSPFPVLPSPNCQVGDGKFLCNNGRCITARYNLCDGMNDCGDSSDEETDVCSPCPTSLISSANSFHCNNNKCISPSSLCDGDNDCGDYSDETICGPCSSNMDMFRCANNKCIHNSYLCDGNDNCDDRSDETGQACLLAAEYLSKKQQCPPRTIKCKSKSVCVPYSKLCDGTADCCPPPSSSSSGSSILDILLGTSDSQSSLAVTENETHVGTCEKTDELGCLKNVFCSTNNGGCSSDATCVTVTKPPEANVCGGITPATVYGYCACAPGFVRPSANAKLCQDFDECQASPFLNNCSQTCTNTQGSFNCSCKDGFTNSSSVGTCTLSDNKLNDALSIVFVYHDSIRVWRHSDNKAVTVHRTLFNQTYPALTVDIRDGTVIFYNGSLLLRTSLPTPGRQNAPTTVLHHDFQYEKVADMAVDFIGGNLYVVNRLGTDSKDSRIVVSQTNGLYQKTLIYSRDSVPTIAVNPFRGRLYYSTYSITRSSSSSFSSSSTMTVHDSRLIMTAMNGDGANTQTIYTSSKKKLIMTVAVDYLADGNLYFSEGTSVMLSTFDGGFATKYPTTLQSMGNRNFDVFGNNIYGLFARSLLFDYEVLYEIDKFRPNLVKNLTTTLSIVGDLRVYHPLKAGKPTSWPDPCGQLNCSHLCLLDWNGQGTCACPDSDTSSRDQAVCEAPTMLDPDHPTDCFRKCSKTGGVCVTEDDSDNKLVCVCRHGFQGQYCDEVVPSSNPNVSRIQDVISEYCPKYCSENALSDNALKCPDAIAQAQMRAEQSTSEASTHGQLGAIIALVVVVLVVLLIAIVFGVYFWRRGRHQQKITAQYGLQELSKSPSVGNISTDTHRHT